METMHSNGRFPMLFRNLQLVTDVNPLDNQNPSILFYLATNPTDQNAVTSRNLTRFQRAAKGASQSTRRR